MTAKNIKTQKFISSLFIISLLLPVILLSLQPERAKAQGAEGVPVNDFAAELSLKAIAVSTATIATNTPVIATQTTLTALTTVKAWIQKLLEILAMIAAKAVLAQITRATIAWINSGFHGAPLYLERPESFFANIAKSEIKSVVTLIGYDQLKFPFGPQTANNIINSYKSQLATNAQYTLSQVSGDASFLASFRNNFSVGGWNGFLLNTQYPQNNYLGFQMMVGENLSTNLQGVFQAPAQQVQSLLQQGMGFLSPQTCPSNPGANPQVKNSCPGGWVNTTPGSVAANQIMTALNIHTNNKLLDASLGSSISAILDALLDQVMSKVFGAGLNALGGAGSMPNVTLPGLLSTTTDNTPPTTTPGALLVNNATSTSVSLTAGQSTTVTISGGSGSGYLLTGGNSGIETQTISGNTLTIITGQTGQQTGTTTITVSDSAGNTATVNVAVNAVGALVASPSSVTLNVTDNPVTVNITGGSGTYSITTSPNQSLVAAGFGGSTLIVGALAAGSTSVTITDTADSTKSVTIPITITAPASTTPPGGTVPPGGEHTCTTTTSTTTLSVSPYRPTTYPDLSIYVCDTIRIPLSGGVVTPYIIDPGNTGSPEVTATISGTTISGTTLIITCNAPADTHVMVEDSYLYNGYHADTNSVRIYCNDSS